MKDWKKQFIKMASLTPVFDGDMPEHEYERKLIVFIETLLQEEREKVVEEIIQDIEKMKRNPPLEATEGMINGFHKIQEHLSKKGEKK